MDIPFASIAALVADIGRLPARKASQRASDATPKIELKFANWVASHLAQPLLPGTGKRLFRLLFPDLDAARRYGLQETALASNLPQIMGVRAERGQRGQGLAAWAVSDDLDRRPGCLGIECGNIIRQGGATVGVPLMLKDVDDLLDELASYSKWSDADLQKSGHTQTRYFILAKLLRCLNAEEYELMVQVILRDLRPLLYRLPVGISSFVALEQYRSNAHHELTIHAALSIWHWAAPQIYHVRNSTDHTLDRCEMIPRVDAHGNELGQNARDDLIAPFIKPEMGVIVEVPKASKGTSAEACIKQARSGREHDFIYAETKYDGERMQIHIDLDRPGPSQITIFSKSRRDSTQERIGVTSILRLCLGLPFTTAQLQVNERMAHVVGMHPSATKHPRHSARFRKLIIEAELVGWNDRAATFAEFWRLEKLLGRAPGTRAFFAPMPDDTTSQDSTTTASTRLNTSPDMPPSANTRDIHLAVVFFDVLRVDSRSLLSEPYETRRTVLETLVKPIEGFAMLAERERIDLINHDKAVQALEVVFAKIKERCDEGLVIKAARSLYNDRRRGMQWIKLKKDYIPHHGDTVSMCIVAAGFDKDRARQLLVPAGTFVTWFVGLETNRAQQRQDVKPHYLILFACHSFGTAMTRAQLLDLNDRVERRTHIEHSAFSRLWPFSYSAAAGLSAKIGVVFERPFVVDLYGDRWTRDGDAKLYELRFPRIAKIHSEDARRPTDWSDVVDLQQCQSIARAALRPRRSPGGRTLDDSPDADAYMADAWDRSAALDRQQALLKEGVGLGFGAPSSVMPAYDREAAAKAAEARAAKRAAPLDPEVGERVAKKARTGPMPRSDEVIVLDDDESDGDGVATVFKPSQLGPSSPVSDLAPFTEVEVGGEVDAADAAIMPTSDGDDAARDEDEVDGPDDDGVGAASLFVGPFGQPIVAPPPPPPPMPYFRPRPDWSFDLFDSTGQPCLWAIHTPSDPSLDRRSINRSPESCPVRLDTLFAVSGFTWAGDRANHPPPLETVYFVSRTEAERTVDDVARWYHRDPTRPAATLFVVDAAVLASKHIAVEHILMRL